MDACAAKRHAKLIESRILVLNKNHTSCDMDLDILCVLNYAFANKLEGETSELINWLTHGTDSTDKRLLLASVLQALIAIPYTSSVQTSEIESRLMKLFTLQEVQTDVDLNKVLGQLLPADKKGFSLETLNPNDFDEFAKFRQSPLMRQKVYVLVVRNCLKHLLATTNNSYLRNEYMQIYLYGVLCTPAHILKNDLLEIIALSGECLTAAEYSVKSKSYSLYLLALLSSGKCKQEVFQAIPETTAEELLRNVMDFMTGASQNHDSEKIRLAGVQCLMELTNMPLYLTIRYKNRVIKCLNALRNDPKRNVRIQVAKAINNWQIRV
ncbi:hypothetical protein Ciccas_005757 [Cichlidogyrus casuarinus]|uniref:MMS19 nucleotide excision repair protein n=1 Tax=Cichlidogyrus casuarinus TaxID=1844966 RepID=A0ABD2Q7R4_9PLAT